MYFPSEKFVENSEKHKLIEACRRYLKEFEEFPFDDNDVRRYRRYIVDGNDFRNSETIRAAVDVEQKLETIPEFIVYCAGLAMHSLLLEAMENEPSDGDNKEISKTAISLPVVNARFVNLCRTQPIKSLEVKHCFITVNPLCI